MSYDSPKMHAPGSDKGMSPMQDASCDIDNALDVLSKELHTLESRLALVLRPSSPSPEKPHTGLVSVSKSQAVEQMYGTARRIREMHDLVNELNTRLDV